MIPNNPTYVNIPAFGTSATLTAPPGGVFTAGYAAGVILPTENVSYFFNGFTKNDISQQTNLNYVIVEINNVLTNASITPSTGTSNQLLMALQAAFVAQTVPGGSVSIAGTLGVTGAVTLSTTLAVTGNTALTGTLTVAGGGTFSSTLSVSGNTTVGGTLGVTGAATFNGVVNSATLAVTGNSTIGGTLGVTGAATMSSTLTVTGNAAMNGNVTIATTKKLTLNQPGTPVDIYATSPGNMNIDGQVAINPGLTTTNIGASSIVSTTANFSGNLTQDGYIVQNGTGLKTRVVATGGWNMNLLKNIDMGVSRNKVVSIDVIVGDDTGVYTNSFFNAVTSGVSGAVEMNNGLGDNILLLRPTPGGIFTSGGYTSTSGNRGYVYIVYQA